MRDQVDAAVRDHVTAAVRHWAMDQCEYGPENCVGADLWNKAHDLATEDPDLLAALYLSSIQLAAGMVAMRAQEGKTDGKTP